METFDLTLKASYLSTCLVEFLGATVFFSSVFTNMVYNNNKLDVKFVGGWQYSGGCRSFPMYLFLDYSYVIFFIWNISL
ncbi:hypothetical protein JHK82_023035 [Glycine max]|nr:hypothetical protein JHK82_023035 [Glycine max]